MVQYTINALVSVLVVFQVAVLCFSTFSHAAPAPSVVSTWIDQQIHPKKGGTPAQEIQCYALPYGGLGFLSHALTYYQIIIVSFHRTPLAPWRKLSLDYRFKASFSVLWDITINVISMIWSVTLAGFTISSCRNSWPFVLIGVWKATLSISLNAVGITRVLMAPSLLRRNDKKPKALWGTFLYAFGTIVGSVGLLYLVHKTFWQQPVIRIETYVLCGLLCVATLIIICVAMIQDKPSDSVTAGLLIAQGIPFFGLSLFAALAIFYSDWVLATISDNWAGLPSSDHKVLWTLYFVAKRLPLFTI